MQSFMLYILYYVFVYNTVSCIYTGCFLLVPPILLEYGTCPPSTQNFAKSHTGPLNTKIIFSSEQILYQNSQGLGQVLVLRGASLTLNQICVEGGVSSIL